MNSNLNHKLTWGSNVPVINAALKAFNINSAFEFGIGNNSTPTFHENCENVISVENDLEWIKKCNIKITENKKVIHHKVPGHTIHTRPWGLSKEWFEEQKQYYLDLYAQYPNFDLLFIDQYITLRNICAEALHDKFKIVILHDVEPFHQDHGLWLNYATVPRTMKYTGFTVDDKFAKFIDKTTRVWTGILVRQDLLEHINEFERLLKEEWREWGGQNATLERDDNFFSKDGVSSY